MPFPQPQIEVAESDLDYEELDIRKILTEADTIWLDLSPGLKTVDAAKEAQRGEDPDEGVGVADSSARS